MDRYALSAQSRSYNVTVEQSGTSYILYREINIFYDYYLRYNNGWTVTSSTDSSVATPVNLYKKITETATWTVNPELQEARITALTVTNDGYTDASWSAYNAARAAANAKLTEVKAATYTLEEDARAALNALIALVDALETAKNNLKKAVSITVNYIADGITVKTETLIVAEDAKSVKLNAVFTAENGTKYSVENTTLALTAGCYFL